MLENLGYLKTDNLDLASIYVLNTCCVRENAEEKLFGKLGELKKLKAKNDGVFVLCGCMLQEKHIQEKLKQSYPYVDIILGTHTLHKLPEDLYNLLTCIIVKINCMQIIKQIINNNKTVIKEFFE